MRQRMMIDPNMLSASQTSGLDQEQYSKRHDGIIAPPTLRLGTTTVTSMVKRVATTTTKNTAHKTTTTSPPSKLTVTKKRRQTNGVVRAF